MQGPQAWLAYLRSFEEAGPANGLSLKVIFHHAAPLARHQKSLEWAEVAIRAAELDSRRGSDTEREESLLKAMTLRSWFISQMGSRRPVGPRPILSASKQGTPSEPAKPQLRAAVQGSIRQSGRSPDRQAAALLRRRPPQAQG